MLNLFFRKSEDNMFEDFRLKVFMAVAETGSFTKAAKSIGIQPEYQCIGKGNRHAADTAGER